VDTTKKEIEPLKQVGELNFALCEYSSFVINPFLGHKDHSSIQYMEVAKDFYEEHAEIADLSAEMVQSLRHKMEIRVSGVGVVKPVMSFAHFGFDDALLQTIIQSGFSEPTIIQKQAVPVALCGRDIIGVAETGKYKSECGRTRMANTVNVQGPAKQQRLCGRCWCTLWTNPS
jgi:hypothetical protein